MALDYTYQDDVLVQMNNNITGLVEMPTGTGKGEIICRHAYETYTEFRKRIKGKKKPPIRITVNVSDRIMLSQQMQMRMVKYSIKTKKQKPAYVRMSVHSGDATEYSDLDSTEERMWVSEYPDQQCYSTAQITEEITKAINLGQDLSISTTYHSLNKVLKSLKDLKIKAKVGYLDEIHRGVARDDWFKTLKDFSKQCEKCFGFTATPGNKRGRIQSLLGATIYYMDMHRAINMALICKPRWMIVEVDGNKENNLAQGVVKALEEYESHTGLECKALVNCLDSVEIASIADSKFVNDYRAKHIDLLVAEVSSARGARLNGVEVSRQDFLDALQKHTGRMLVLHIDICNSGIDVPDFNFPLWTYYSDSETYVTQGNGRGGRLNKEDRLRLERGEINTQDRTNWIKSYNTCGMLAFLNTLEEDIQAFVEFVLKSREQGFDPKDTIYAGSKSSVTKKPPFDPENKGGRRQSHVEVAVTVALENESLREMVYEISKLEDPMNIFKVLQ